MGFSLLSPDISVLDKSILIQSFRLLEVVPFCLYCSSGASLFTFTSFVFHFLYWHTDISGLYNNDPNLENPLKTENYTAPYHSAINQAHHITDVFARSLEKQNIYSAIFLEISHSAEWCGTRFFNQISLVVLKSQTLWRIFWPQNYFWWCTLDLFSTYCTPLTFHKTIEYFRQYLYNTMILKQL